MDDAHWMRRALALAAHGEGFVEPNPMVGCVLIRDGVVVGEGLHRRFGGPHAEVEAIQAAGDQAAGATCYVTLEPCCHTGKTPPCTEKILASGIRRVVAAMRDPFPKVDGGGLDRLRGAGLDVSVGLLEREARQLNAPYLTRLEKKRPWIIAKWAMTLDGKIASVGGDSRWISSDASRNIVHRLRARMDAILVGSGTAQADNCRLTVRLRADEPGPRRTPLRIVWNSSASISLDSRLVRSAGEAPVLIVASPDAAPERVDGLRGAGCEVFTLTRPDDDGPFWEHLARRGVTNLLVEGGSRVLGFLFDRQRIDEVHVFLAPKLIGGVKAPSPIAGNGLRDMAAATRLVDPVIEIVDGDVYLRGRLRRTG